MADLVAAADRCVKCGLCLPNCPTYRLTRNEGESPRGRVALVDALANGDFVGANGAAHLDSCLLCLNCASTCPSMVDLKMLLHEGRQRARANRRLAAVARFASSGRRVRIVNRLLRRSGIGSFIGRLGRFAAQVSPSIGRVQTSGEARRQVMLAGGCADNGLRGSALGAIARVLAAAGYQVSHPAPDQCCGALEYHHHARAAGLRRLRQWHAAHRATDPATPILHASSACAAFTVNAWPNAQIHELCGWTAREHALRGLPFHPLSDPVAIHTPCSQRNQLKDSSSASALLEEIPGIELFAVNGLGCCGAAGLAMMSNPKRADTLARMILDEAQRQGVRYLVSTNAGCLLNLRATALAQNGPEVLHPFELLDRQLIRRDIHA